MVASAEADLSLAESVCLALVAEGATHGWQVGTLLSPDGEIGRIWSLTRPLTYRALEHLTDKRLLRRTPAAQRAGRERQVLKVTARGRRMADDWLDSPVEHLREVRTDLLLKLVLRERAGLDVEPLLRDQHAHFDERISTLTSGANPPDLVGLWRRESARAVRRFLDAALPPAADDPDPAPVGSSRTIDLDLAPGDEVIVVIKSTEVMIAKP